MTGTGRLASALAAVALGAGVVVIIVTPEYLRSPNSLAIPSAFVVGIGAAAAFAGGRWGTRIALLISTLGLILSGLWYWLAGDGFGMGTPWVDDMVEAGVLSCLFVAAIVLELFARRESVAAGSG